MKSSFNYVIKCVIGSLILILIVQIFWLKKLYDTIGEELSKDILQCIELSDQSELILRMKDINTSKEFTQERNISIQKRINQPNDSVNLDHPQVKEDRGEDISDVESFSLLVKDLGFALHQAIDSIKPINLENLDSLISINLKKRGIKAQLYYTDIIDLENDNVILKSSKKESDTNREYQDYIYEFTDSKKDTYRVHVEPLTCTILLRMSGILITTLLIIFILSFAFWYLIKTVIRQKTLEEMKDDFINNMTHELKTPIAVAYSAADTLLNFKQGDNPEKRKKYLAICKEQLSGLGWLVEQILSMSMERHQMFVLNKKDIDIIYMVNNLITQHRLKSDKHIDFQLHVTPVNLNIYADYIHLNNVISNLIDNAVKYSGKSVSIIINIFEKEEYNIIEIIDKGIGISEEKQPYIFDKFFQVTYGNKYNVKGYGLGLFYVKTMIERHNGIISVNSKKGIGTIFSIKIPIKR